MSIAEYYDVADGTEDMIAASRAYASRGPTSEMIAEEFGWKIQVGCGTYRYLARR